MEIPKRYGGNHTYSRNPSDLQLSLPPIKNSKKAPVLKASLIVARKKSKDSIASHSSKRSGSNSSPNKAKPNKSKKSLPKIKGNSLDRSYKY